MLKHLRSPEKRQTARLDRVERWGRPLGSRGDEIRALWASLVGDHTLLRLFFLNSHAVDDRVRRGAQPLPHQIDALAREGFRTIVDLRATFDNASYTLEKEACARNGLELVHFRVMSRAAPNVQMILDARTLFEQIEYPAFIHCKSGADRAGLMSALYLIFVRGAPVEEAAKQLSLRFGHIRHAKPGILSAFFRSYLESGSARDFEGWLREEYDPQELIRNFSTRRFASLMGDVILARE
jgi:protein tyrosine/serine phosphatase